MRVPKRARDFRLGRLAARRALSLAGAPLGLLEVGARADGSPEARREGRPLRASLSISHAGGRGLAGVAPCGAALGVDLERVEIRSAAFEADYLTERERARLPPTEEARARAVTLAWSAKESALKVLRLGLRGVPRDFEVVGVVEPEAGWADLRVRGPGAEAFAGAWRVVEGLVATVLIRGGDAPHLAPHDLRPSALAG